MQSKTAKRILWLCSFYCCGQIWIENMQKHTKSSTWHMKITCLYSTYFTGIGYEIRTNKCIKKFKSTAHRTQIPLVIVLMHILINASCTRKTHLKAKGIRLEAIKIQLSTQNLPCKHSRHLFDLNSTYDSTCQFMHKYDTLCICHIILKTWPHIYFLLSWY